MQKKSIHTTINKEQAEALFRENAVLFGSVDGVPTDTAVKLFGESAVKAACRDGDYNAFTFEEKYVKYLYRRGFFYAASLHNVQEAGSPIHEGFLCP